jgi:hypothetical protein
VCAPCTGAPPSAVLICALAGVGGAALVGASFFSRTAMAHQTPSASTHYWLLIDGAPTGPFDLAAIKAKVLTGEITDEASACPLGSHTWTPLKQVFATDIRQAVQVLSQQRLVPPNALPIPSHPDRPPDPVIIVKRELSRRAFLLAIGALVLGIGGTLGFVYWPSGYLLAGPAMQKGAVIRNETRMTIVGAMTLSAGKDAVSGIMTIEDHQITETLVIAVAAGQPNKLENKFLTDGSTVRVSIGNEPEKVTTDKGIFSGRSIQLEKVAGIWKQSLVGGNPDPAQLRALQAEWVPDDIYPSRRLSIGETWTVSGSHMRRLFGMSDALSFDGTGAFTLQDIVVRDGEKCAVIRAQIEVRATMLDEQNQEAVLEMAISGHVYRSLKSLLDVVCWFSVIWTNRSVELAVRG